MPPTAQTSNSAPTRAPDVPPLELLLPEREELLLQMVILSLCCHGLSQETLDLLKHILLLNEFQTIATLP